MIIQSQIEMDSQVANTSNSISRNKRKFRPDSPCSETNKFVSSSINNLPIYEIPSQNTETIQTNDNHIGSLSHDQLNLYDFDEWTDLTETQLKDIVCNNLETIFKCAINKVVACGYSEEAVIKSVLRSGVYSGPKDIMSNIVNNSLRFIRNGQEYDRSKEHCFENLEQLEKYILAELVCTVREVRPSFSTGDALWCLLLCDMNVTNACTLDDSLLSTRQLPQAETKTDNPRSEFCFSASSKPNFVKPKKSSVSPISLTENGGKSVGTRKISGIRPKSFHLERTYRRYGSKGSPRSGKFNSFGRLVLDKKSRSLSESEGINLKTATVKITKTTAVDKQRRAEASTGCAIALDTKFREGTQNHLADSVDKPQKTETETETETRIAMKYDVLTTLMQKEYALLEQLGKWDEWANRKVMQVAQRLGKDKAERKALLQERDEVERVRNERQALEESTAKKLSEMEIHFCKLGREMEWASGAIRRLEGENAWLRRETEAARANGEEAAAKLREGVKREKEAASRVGKWEKERGSLQDELVVEKRRAVELDRAVELAKDRRDQGEVRWKQEEKAKEKLLEEADMVRAEREELEASAKSQEETIKSNSETNLKKYKDEIHILEKEFSLLRLKKDSSKIAALRQGIEHVDPKKAYNRDLSTKVAANLEDQLSDVKRERECVMCLSEEMSVVFLPCAHQVLCLKCNELHEKQGMKDCPSCRGPIQQRISVRYA